MINVVRSPAQAIGESAYEVGTAFLGNPFKRNTPSWYNWRKGWLLAMSRDKGHALGHFTRDITGIRRKR